MCISFYIRTPKSYIFVIHTKKHLNLSSTAAHELHRERHKSRVSVVVVQSAGSADDDGWGYQTGCD